MARTAPVMSTQTPGNFITSSLWNAQVAALGNFLLAPPRFMGYNSTATQSVINGGSGTLTAIQLDSSQFDSEGGHSNTVNNTRYTCQVAGLYKIDGRVSFSGNTTGSRGAGWTVNGTSTGLALGAGNTSATTPVNVGMTVACAGYQYLNVGDYVELVGYQTSGATLTVQSTFYACVLSLLWVASS